MKKLYITLIAIVSLLSFVGCSRSEQGTSIDTGRFTVEHSSYLTEAPGLDFIIVISDKNTSVQYLVVNRGGHIAITPLLK